jgi:hypothetical protein
MTLTIPTTADLGLRAEPGGASQAPAPLCAANFTDPTRGFIVTQLLVDVRNRSNFLVENNVDDEQARASLAGAYRTIRDHALGILADPVADSADFGLPDCGADATVAEVGTAAELASTFLNSLIEMGAWEAGKRVEAAGAQAALRKAAELGDADVASALKSIGSGGSYL